MSLYHETADILSAPAAAGGNLKTRIFGRKDLKSPQHQLYALALETYAMDFWPVVNEGLLAEYFFEHRVGRFAEPGFRGRVTIFEPAIERRVFHPPQRPEGRRPRRLLFYARPSNHRNLFGPA